MAHMPMDDARELWNQASGHNWASLHQTLEGHKGKAGGIENDLVTLLLQVTKNLENSKQPYPQSAQQLYDVLNKQLQQTG